MFKEFKQFVSRGNVVELAVGLIMATYFGAITKSFVNDILMPPIGLAIGGVDFAELKVVLKEGVAEVTGADGAIITEAVPEVAIMYGTFLNTIVTFIIVAFAVFMVARSYNRFMKKEEKKAEPGTPPPPSKDIQLLSEIRDLLKNRP